MKAVVVVPAVCADAGGKNVTSQPFCLSGLPHRTGIKPCWRQPSCRSSVTSLTGRGWMMTFFPSAAAQTSRSPPAYRHQQSGCHPRRY